MNRWFVCFVYVVFLIACDSDRPVPAKSNEIKDSWAYPHFEKVDSLNPILSPSSDLEYMDPITKNMVQWESRNVLNPTALVKDDKVYLMYRAQDVKGTSRIGMAISTDGLNFEKTKTPVFYPDFDEMKKYEWNYKKSLKKNIGDEGCKTCFFDGVEDPRIVEHESGEYFMTYTAYEGRIARLAIASSDDLITWKKHGLVLGEGKYRDTWSKAGAIVSELQGSRIVAKRINGKYWMYFGDTALTMATSDDLVTWEVLEDAESGNMIQVLHPRKGYFDSRLVEPGPYALYKDEGILLIYNSSNAANYNDATIPKFTYSGGQALFDKDEPYKLVARGETNFIRPDKDYEKVGEVNEVCFVEGLVFFKEKWFLYYGTADSKIAVAVYSPSVN